MAGWSGFARGRCDREATSLSEAGNEGIKPLTRQELYWASISVDGDFCGCGSADFDCVVRIDGFQPQQTNAVVDLSYVRESDGLKPIFARLCCCPLLVWE